MKTTKSKTKGTIPNWKYSYPYEFQPESKRSQLVYLAISVAVIAITFITLILI